MKKTIITLVFAIGMIATTFGQSNSIMIRTVEKMTFGFSGANQQMTIIQENGTVNTTDIEKHSKKGMVENMITVKNTLDGYLNNGYELISSTVTTVGHNGAFLIEHTYILKKE
jgi:hypothetical protein